MKKLKPWQIALLIIFYPAGIVYLIWKYVFKTKASSFNKEKYSYQGLNFYENEPLNSLQIQIRMAKKAGADLLEMSEHPCTCGECAKYQGRVFSISGKSKKFPKLPEHFIKIGGVHEGCRHDFYPYFEDMPPAYHKDIVKYSNRPFVDNRTKAQKEMYEKEMRKIEDEEKDRENFNWCYENLEDLCPKSFSGYRRMKNSNSANFQKLCAAAAEKGRNIS